MSEQVDTTGAGYQIDPKWEQTEFEAAQACVENWRQDYRRHADLANWGPHGAAARLRCWRDIHDKAGEWMEVAAIKHVLEENGWWEADEEALSQLQENE